MQFLHRYVKGEVSFQPVNTGQGAHLPLKTNGPVSIFQNEPATFQAFPVTHLYTWGERSSYGTVPYSRTQHIARNGAQTHNLLFMNPALIC